MYADGVDLPEPPSEADSEGPTVISNVEFYRGATEAFPRGKTFMNNFYTNPHNRKIYFILLLCGRNGSLRLGSLRLGLSMVSINTFLSLHLVSILLFAPGLR